MAKKKTAGKPTKFVVLPVPQTLEEANDYLRRIGEAQRRAAQVEHDLNQEIEKLKAKAGEEMTQIEAEFKALTDGFFTFAQNNRGELTGDEASKTVRIPAGYFYWKRTPFSVKVQNEQEVIRELERRRLTRFIRTKKEVDREAMLRERDVVGKVPGITIEQSEQFYICPANVAVDVSGTVGKTKLKGIKVTEREEKKSRES